VYRTGTVTEVVHQVQYKSGLMVKKSCK